MKCDVRRGVKWISVAFEVSYFSTSSGSRDSALGCPKPHALDASAFYNRVLAGMSGQADSLTGGVPRLSFRNVLCCLSWLLCAPPRAWSRGTPSLCSSVPGRSDLLSSLLQIRGAALLVRVCAPRGASAAVLAAYRRCHTGARGGRFCTCYGELLVAFRSPRGGCARTAIAPQCLHTCLVRVPRIPRAIFSRCVAEIIL